MLTYFWKGTCMCFSMKGFSHNVILFLFYKRIIPTYDGSVSEKLFRKNDIFMKAELVFYPKRWWWMCVTDGCLIPTDVRCKSDISSVVPLYSLQQNSLFSFIQERWSFTINIWILNIMCVNSLNKGQIFYYERFSSGILRKKYQSWKKYFWKSTKVQFS